MTVFFHRSDDFRGAGLPVYGQALFSEYTQAATAATDRDLISRNDNCSRFCSRNCSGRIVPNKMNRPTRSLTGAAKSADERG